MHFHWVAFDLKSILDHLLLMTNECRGFILQETQQKCLQGLIGQQTARQPMEKYNVHLTSKSEKKKLMQKY